jgi:hypothetical protein
MNFMDMHYVHLYAAANLRAVTVAEVPLYDPSTIISCRVPILELGSVRCYYPFLPYLESRLTYNDLRHLLLLFISPLLHLLYTHNMHLSHNIQLSSYVSINSQGFPCYDLRSADPPITRAPKRPVPIAYSRS